MRFCQDHWDRLRQAIHKRGLGSLIAPTGETAVAQMAAELEAGEGPTPTTFDPLMSAHWAIANNVMETMQRAGANPLYLMASDETSQDPVDPAIYGAEHDGRTWPRCPLCYLGLAHEVSCNDPRCKLPKIDGYAWMIDRAADDALEKARELGLREAA